MISNSFFNLGVTFQYFHLIIYLKYRTFLKRESILRSEMFAYYH